MFGSHDSAAMAKVLLNFLNDVIINETCMNVVYT